MSHQELVAELVRGKHVLDVGCVDHKAAISQSPRWLHRHIIKTAASVVGLDIAETEAATLRAEGYDIVCGDAATISLGCTFDIIVVGEMIEHVDNPGMLLSNMARHLRYGGRIVLTTPYVHFSWHWLESLIWQPETRWNPEHVAWYCPFTLGNLLHRNGFAVEECYVYTRSRKQLRIQQLLRVSCPKFLASSFAVIARRVCS